MGVAVYFLLGNSLKPNRKLMLGVLLVAAKGYSRLTVESHRDFRYHMTIPSNTGYIEISGIK